VYLRKVGKSVSRLRLSSLLGLSRTSCYYQHKQEEKDELLKEQVLDCLRLNPAYGHRRIALDLNLGKKRVRRVMRKFGTKPYKRKARWRKRRDERRKEAPYQNLIKGICPIKPNLVWATDFTYLRFKGRFVYLATFMDLFTGEVVGWSMSTKHNKQLIFNAFFDALQNAGQLPLIIHSDQGAEYTSKEYVNLLASLNIKISMSKKASPWENGYQESFYNNFKTELGLEIDRYQTISHLIEAIHFQMNYYNHRRIQRRLKTSPVKFKLLHQAKQNSIAVSV
jgi:transposase InsO family protein